MKRWPTMPVAPRIPTGSLFDMVSCDFIPAKILAGNAVAGTTEQLRWKARRIGIAARSSITRRSDGRLARLAGRGRPALHRQAWIDRHNNHAGLDTRFEVGRVPGEMSTR